MIKRIAYGTIAISLAVLLLFGTTAKEFIHIFAHHTDTVHTHHGDGLVLEPEHHHCTFLKYSLTAFNYEAPQYYSRYIATHYPSYAATMVAQLTARRVPVPALRGPPAA